MAKHLAEKYSFSHAYVRSIALIEQRVKQIEHHLQRAEAAIHQFAEKIVSRCAPYGDCTSAMITLSSILHQFVQEKQWSLQHEFDYKRQMLILDATDHQLVHKFFNLKPNKSHVKTQSPIDITTFSITTNIHLFQIISARRIWQATMAQIIIEEDIALLEHRLTSNNPQPSSNLVYRMIDDIETMLEKSNEMADTFVMKHCSCSEMIRLESLKKDLINQAIITSRGLIENHNAMIQNEQHKYSTMNKYLESTAEWQKTVLDIIEVRRVHMIQHGNYILKYKLAKSFNMNDDQQEPML